VAGAGHAQGQDPGALKSLPQRPRGRFVPLPESAKRLAEELGTPEGFGSGSLTDALLKVVRAATSLDVKRADFKLDMVPAHLFMNFRVVDEHGRQLGTGRNLGALKAELGAQARGAFQALAGLKLAQGASSGPSDVKSDSKQPNPSVKRSQDAINLDVSGSAAGQRHTAWTFGELPELMEIRKGGQTIIGFPALIDVGDAVTIEVFDEPEVAAARHRAGLRRLFALQLKEALKYLEKNIPDLQKMAVAYMPLGTLEELREQIIDVALERAFLLEPLPANEADFKRRLDEGRGRLTLIANEVARLASVILTEYAAERRAQRLVLLGKAEAHHALVEAVAVEGRQRDGRHAHSRVSHWQKSASGRSRSRRRCPRTGSSCLRWAAASSAFAPGPRGTGRAWLVEGRQLQVGRGVGQVGGQAVLHGRVDGEHVELVHLAEFGRQRGGAATVPTFQPVTWKVLPKLDTMKARAARPGKRAALWCSGRRTPCARTPRR
jgi:hypothetical protein